MIDVMVDTTFEFETAFPIARKLANEMIAWCDETAGVEHYYCFGDILQRVSYCFVKTDHAMMFKLRWAP